MRKGVIYIVKTNLKGESKSEKNASQKSFGFLFLDILKCPFFKIQITFWEIFLSFLKRSVCQHNAANTEKITLKVL